MIIEIPNDRNKSGLIGGNKMPLRYKICEVCAEVFGPINTEKQMACSKQCGYEIIKSKPKKEKMIVPKKVRSAQRRVSYLISIGKMTRSESCEACNSFVFTEACHYDYDLPEKVRWLCRSCHVKWDKASPKIARWEKYTGKEATLENQV